MSVLDKTALEQSAMLDSGELSAEALMQATLDRVDAVNPEVNALVSMRDGEDLLAEARAADSAERKGWLHGMPIAVKDLADAAGLPNTKGSPLLVGNVPQKDEVMVARMKAAGAIVIGKTNVPEFGLGSHTFNPVFGATKNPYDPARTCGGSSGGAAVGLACRMLSVADGSDMMGSLRNPAGWNNVYGMRPSVGLIPDEVQGDTYLQRQSTLGPMARNPRDLAAVLDTMAGPDSRQPFHLQAPNALAQIEADVTGRRIGWLGDWGGAFAYEPGIVELCETALGQMGDLGLAVEGLEPPHPAKDIWDSWVGLRHFAIASKLSDFYAVPENRERLKKPVQYEIEAGLTYSAMDIHRFSTLRSAWFHRAAELFDTYDALALPVAQVWPFPVEQEYPTEIAGRAMDTYHRWMEVMIPASLIGLPAISLPIGFGETGLPMGLQIIGRQGDDARLLQIAEAWHQATDWPNKRPPEIVPLS